MRRLAMLAVLLAMLDAGLLVVPFKPDEQVVDRVAAPPPTEPYSARRAGVAADWVRMILARPLFDAERRPLRVEEEPGMAQPGLPRLTGIIVAASIRHALFATPVVGRSMVVGEGDQFGSFEVTSIQAGAVELSSPDGHRTVYPMGDAGFRAASETSRPLLALVTPMQRELETETDQ